MIVENMVYVWAKDKKKACIRKRGKGTDGESA
jgi:hypothetical protein